MALVDLKPQGVKTPRGFALLRIAHPCTWEIWRDTDLAAQTGPAGTAGRGAGGRGGHADVVCLCSCSGQIKTEPYKAFISFSLLGSTAASVCIGEVPPVEEPSPLPYDPRAVWVIFACVISLLPASLLLRSCHPGLFLCRGRRGKGSEGTSAGSRPGPGVQSISRGGR